MSQNPDEVERITAMFERATSIFKASQEAEELIAKANRCGFDGRRMWAEAQKDAKVGSRSAVASMRDRYHSAIGSEPS